MWKSGICIGIVLVLTLIATSTNLLLTAKGDYNGLINPYKDFRWDKIKMKVNMINTGDKSTKLISYDNAYKEICKDNKCTGGAVPENDWCNALKKLRDGGKSFVGVSIAAQVFLAIAICFCVLVSLGKCLCKCKYRFSYIIVGLHSFGILLLFIAICIVFGQYFGNLNDTLDGLLWCYYPAIYSTVNWNSAVWGITFIMIFLAFSVGLCSCCFILGHDKKNDKHSQYSINQGYIIYEGNNNNNIEGQNNNTYNTNTYQTNV